MSVPKKYRLPDEPAGDRPLSQETLHLLRRNAFYTALEHRAPAVFDHLKLIGVPATERLMGGDFQTQGRSAVLRGSEVWEVLLQWSNRWRIDADWVREDAADFLVDFIENREFGRELPTRILANADFPPVKFYLIQIEQFSSYLPTEVYSSQTVKDQFMQQLEVIVDAQMREQEARMGDSVEWNELSRDMEILVDYQIHDKSKRAIACDFGLSRTSIKQILDRSSAEIGLALRDGGRPGRPRSK